MGKKWSFAIVDLKELKAKVDLLAEAGELPEQGEIRLVVENKATGNPVELTLSCRSVREDEG